MGQRQGLEAGEQEGSSRLPDLGRRERRAAKDKLPQSAYRM